MDSPFFEEQNIREVVRQIEIAVQKTTRSDYTFDVPPAKLADRMFDLAVANPHRLQRGTPELNTMLVAQAVAALTDDGDTEYMPGFMRSDRGERGLVETAPQGSTAAVLFAGAPVDLYKEAIRQEEELEQAVVANDLLSTDTFFKALQGPPTDTSRTKWRGGGRTIAFGGWNE